MDDEDASKGPALRFTEHINRVTPLHGVEPHKNEPNDETTDEETTPRPTPPLGKSSYDTAWPSQRHESSHLTGYTFDPRLLRHEHPHEEHPEQPTRLRVIDAALQTTFGSRLAPILGRAISDVEVLQCHEPAYLAWLKELPSMEPLEHEKRSIYHNQATLEAALLAAGSVLTMAELIVQGRLRNGFAAVRPPGHHAECNAAFGFCFLNNVALAAQHVRLTCNVRRVAILDWDIHHGNGTQHMFYSDPSVLYISLHRHEHGLFFPQSAEGDVTSIGQDAGKGRNVNIPFSDVVMQDADYIHAFHVVIMPMLTEFQPDFILVSAGFDACHGDPIGGYELTPALYGHLTHMLMRLAEGKVLLCLEGGYSLEALPKCAVACVSALLGDPLPRLCINESPSLEAIRTCQQVIAVHRPHWNCFGQVPDLGAHLLDQVLLLDHALDHHPRPLEEAQAFDDDADDADKASLSMLSKTTSLRSCILGQREILRSFWTAYLMREYSMVPLLVEDGPWDGEVCFSQHLATSNQPTIVLVHDLGLAFKAADQLDNVNHLELEQLDSDKVVFPFLPYLQQFLSKDFNVIDVCLSKPPTSSEPPPLEAHKPLMDPGTSILLHLWDRFLVQNITSNFVFIVFGHACHQLPTLFSLRDPIEQCRFVAMFPYCILTKPVPPSRTPWYHQVHLDVCFSSLFFFLVSSSL